MYVVESTPDLSGLSAGSGDAFPPEIYHRAHRPADGSKTRSEWLLDHRCRVPRRARPVAILHQVLDRPCDGRVRCYTLNPEEIELLRDELLAAEPGEVPDRDLLAGARAAGLVLRSYLYPPDDVITIDRLTQAEAADILARRYWLTGSSPDQHIVAEAVSGRELRTRTLTRPGRPEITPHRNGRAFQGVRAGTSSRLIDFDADRHRGTVPLDEHVRRVRLLLGELQRRHPEMRPHVTNVNPGNASCHVLAYAPRLWSVERVAGWVAELRAEFPWLEEWKVYPADLPQVYLPLRLDKATVIDGLLARARHRRKEGGRMRSVDGHDWVVYLDWLESDRPCDPDAVEKALRRATVADRAVVARTPSGQSNGFGGGRHRGRERQLQVDFWEGRLVPPEGESGRLITFALRYLVVAEEFSALGAAGWVMDAVDRLPDSSFILRLGRRGGRDDLRKSLLRSARRLERDNGHQPDPAGSTAKLLAVKAAWDRIGFVLSDHATWHTAPEAPPRRSLVWDDRLAALLPALAAAARCGEEKARELAEEVATHVATRAGELGYQYLAWILKRVGLKSYEDMRTRVMKCLKGTGFLILLTNGVRTARVSRGSVYMLGEMVQFADETVCVTSRARGLLGARAGDRPRPTSAALPGDGGLQQMAQEVNSTPAPPPTEEHLYYHTFSVPQPPACGLRFDLTRLRQEVRRLTSTPKRRRPRTPDVDEAA